MNWWRRRKDLALVESGLCKQIAWGISQNGVHPHCQRKKGHFGAHQWVDPKGGSATWSP